MGLPASITVTVSAIVQDNWQRTQRFRCRVVFTPASGLYPVGGIPIASALNAALMPTTNDKRPANVKAVSLIGSGITYDYIKSTGCLMALLVPPSASLTSGTALAQINSDQMNKIAADQIELDVEYSRNA